MIELKKITHRIGFKTSIYLFSFYLNVWKLCTVSICIQEKKLFFFIFVYGSVLFVLLVLLRQQREHYYSLFCVVKYLHLTWFTFWTINSIWKTQKNERKKKKTCQLFLTWNRSNYRIVNSTRYAVVHNPLSNTYIFNIIANKTNSRRELKTVGVLVLLFLFVSVLVFLFVFVRHEFHDLMMYFVC